MKASGEREFQAAGTASAKALRQYQVRQAQGADMCIGVEK